MPNTVTLYAAVNQQFLYLSAITAIRFLAQLELHGADDATVISGDPQQPLSFGQCRAQTVEIALGILMGNRRVIVDRSAVSDRIG